MEFFMDRPFESNAFPFKATRVAGYFAIRLVANVQNGLAIEICAIKIERVTSRN
jgi:hypothetical protein